MQEHLRRRETRAPWRVHPAMVQQQIAVVTLGIDDLDRSRRFYGDGFGWRAAFESDEIAFFEMNGLILGLWLKPDWPPISGATPTDAPPPFRLRTTFPIGNRSRR